MTGMNVGMDSRSFLKLVVRRDNLVAFSRAPGLRDELARSVNRVT